MKKITIFVFTSFLLVIGILLIMTSFRSTKEYQNKIDITVENLKEIENVILIIACSLRADHLSCYGYERNTSPIIDQLAKDGFLFKNCIAQAPYTVHSVGSIITSKYPRKLFGVNYNGIIPNQAKTFAEFFKDEGFYTAGFMTNPWTSKPMNFHQGFDYYYDTSDLLHLYKDGYTDQERLTHRVWGGKLTEKVIDELKQRKSKFFLQVMYKDNHWPYVSFPPFKGKFTAKKQEEAQVDLYDETILHFDSYVGKLLGALKKENLLDNTLIIITADHGDAFGEYRPYDIGHTELLYNTVINVPLIIYNPNLFEKGVLIDNYTTLMDIIPTTLDLMDIKYDPKNFDGISQKGVIERLSSSDGSKRLIVSETNFRNGKRGMRRSCAIWNQRWKYILNNQKKMRNNKTKLPGGELYDLQNDPNETNNLFVQRKDVAEKIFLLLKDWKEENTPELQKDKILEEFLEENIDPEITQQLKALGYIQ